MKLYDVIITVQVGSLSTALEAGKRAFEAVKYTAGVSECAYTVANRQLPGYTAEDAGSDALNMEREG